MTRPNAPGTRHSIFPRRPAGPNHTARVIAAVLAVAVIAAGPARAQTPTTQPGSPRPTRPTSPARVDKAMQRGLKFLRSARQADGSWNAPQARRYSGGLTALVLRAALAAGAEPNDPMVVDGVKRLTRLQPDWTYALAMHVSLLSRTDPNARARTIAVDTERLVAIQNTETGGWGYGKGHPTALQDPAYVDSSNTLLAVHALATANDAGANVPVKTWTRAIRFWTYSQNDDGGWGYLPPGGKSFRLKPTSYGTTVAGGLSALMRLTDQWARGNPLPGEEPPTRKAAEGAHAWLKKNFAVSTIPGYLWGRNDAFYYHYLWLLGQAGNELGVDRFGEHKPWPAEIKRALLAQQLPDGSWVRPKPGDLQAAPEGSDAVICTSLAILALREANKPVLLHRLRFGAGWSGDFRDAASAARWYDTHVAPACWRSATPKTPLDQLRRAPLLLLNAAGEIALDEALSQRLRSYVRHGGTLLVQAREEGSEFNAQLMEFLQGIFPEYRPRQIAGEHPLFNARFTIAENDRPTLVGLAAGRQVRVVVAMSDISGALHRGRPTGDLPAGRLPANLALYATDGAGPGGGLVGRAPAGKVKVARRITIGRAKHRGDWNTCDAAAERLSTSLANAISIGLVEKPVALTSPISAEIPLLWIAGNRPAKLSTDERKNLQAYIEGGGTVLIDPGAGSEAFYKDITATISAMGLGKLTPIRAASPLLTGKLAGGLGSDVRRVRYSRAVRESRPELKTPALLGVEHDGRVAVVISRYGIACGVEGLPVWNARTLAPADARRVAMNVLLHAMSSKDD